MSRTDKKIMKKSNRVAVTGVIVAIISLGFVIYDRMYHEPKADIQDNPISVEYLNSIRDDNNIYPMFSDEVNSDIQFKGNCATQVLITNDNNEELLLDKIIFEAEDIVVNKNPDLIMNVQAISEKNVQLTLYNDGWGDAENLAFQFNGVDCDLNDYIAEEKLALKVKNVGYGKSEDIILWNNNDIVNDSYAGTLRIRPYCIDNDGKELHIVDWYGSENALVELDKGKFIPTGRGAPSQEIYGIKIDTSKSTYKCEHSISESIEGNGRLELPICFAPDKSSKFRFKVSFEVRDKENKKKIISTEFAKVDFKVSSLISDNFFNAEDLSQHELIEKIERKDGFVKISYPYVDPGLMKNIKDSI